IFLFYFPTDLVAQSEKLTLGLVWTLIRHYHIAGNFHEEETKSKGTDKEKLLKRCNAILEHRGSQPIRNFKADVSSELFQCLLQHLQDAHQTSKTTSNKSLSELDQFETIFAKAEKDFQIPSLLDAED
ncbi:hypothetical protein SARC_15120, partial [Sphaeroforma arctica JP610]